MITFIQNSTIKRMTFALLFLILFTHQYSSQTKCSEGCLICSSSGSCSLCDVENSYALNSSSSQCEIQSIPNCLLSFTKDKCDICQNPYYSQNHECVEVETDKRIVGCIVYASFSTCSICTDDYYLSGGSCEPLTSERKVKDCLKYSSDGCELCLSGFPNYLKDKCITWEEMDLNCLFYYQGQKCLTCEDNYQMSYQILSASDESVYKKMFEQNLLFGTDRIGGLSQNKCSEIPNSGSSQNIKVGCKDSLTLSEACVRCDPSSHFFDFKNKVCQQNPQVRVVENKHKIDNCLSLNLNFECVVCYNGFFLNYSKKKCFAHSTLVDNCLVMSQTIDSHCILCESTHFLQTSSNTCTLRTQTIENCSEYNFFEDKCNICDTNFSLQDNSTKCLEMPTNCLEVNAGTSTPLTCNNCDTNFHLFSGECYEVPTDQVISDCEQYSRTLPPDSDEAIYTCIKCTSTHTLTLNKFLLAANHTSSPDFTPPDSVTNEQKKICVLKSIFYKDVAGCDEYIDGECQTCSEGGKLYTINNSCEPYDDVNVNLIDGCNVYAADGSCEQCIYSYKNEADGKCHTSNSSNCRLFQTSQTQTENPHCILCDENFALHDGNCYDLSSAEADIFNCLLYDNNNKCIYCASGYVNHFSSSQTEGLSKSHKCFDRRIFLSHANADKILACESFEKKSNGDIECFSCIKGYELNKNSHCEPCLPHFIKSNVVDSFVYDLNSSTFYCKNDFSPNNNDCLYFADETFSKCLIFRKGIAGVLILDELNNKFNYKTVPALSMSFFGDLKGPNWRHSRKENISQLPYRIAHKKTLSNSNSKLKHYIFQNNTDYINETILTATCHLGYARNFAGLSMVGDDCNTIVKNCDVRAKVFYTGKTNHSISCSRCFGSGNAVYYTFESINKSLLPNIDQYIQKGYSTAHLPSTFCYPDNLSDAVSNCAIYELKTDNTTYSQSCRQCLPGYKPSYDFTDPSKILSCTAITHCQFSSIGNICEVCDPGYGFEANSNITISRQSCNLLIGKVQYCLEWNGDQNSPSCSECRPGYNSPTSLCKKSIYGDCSNFDSVGNCLKCEGINQISFVTNVIKEVNSGCLVGAYSKLPFCEIQYVENKCFKCFSSFLLNSEGRCFSKNLVFNCSDYDIIAEKCIKCDKNFYLDFDSQKCIPQFSFLKKLSKAEPSTDDQTCQGSYDHISFWSIMKINKGNEYSCASTGIQNCQFIDESKLTTSKEIECLTCDNGHKLVSNIAKQKCLFLEPILNCKTQEYNNEMNLRCLLCDDGYFIDVDGNCKLRNNRPKCAHYYSNFDSCQECEKDYYLDLSDNNTCKIRLNKDDKCLTYFIYKDECQTYISTFQYISQRLYDTTRSPPSNAPETNANENNPNSEGKGIPSCSVYSSEFICKECDSNTYLYLNECKAVSTPINKCIKYSSKNVCSKCDTGYFLSENTCKLILAVNCLIYEDETKCRSCTFEYPYLDTDFNCKKNPEVPNCKLYTSINKCQICEDNFELTQDSKCISIASKVLNCLHYSSDQKCAECMKGYELITTSSVLSCKKVIGIDPYCKSAVSTGNRCAVCRPGYILVNGICDRCDNQNPGCAVCSSNNKGECLMCSSGYTMDSEKKCHANQVIWDSYIKISYDI